MVYPSQGIEVHGSGKHDTTVLNFTPYNGKIADITEADTNKHTFDISAYVPANCLAIIIACVRMAGTGSLFFYPNEETNYVLGNGRTQQFTIAIITQRLQYSLNVANDDFDLYMFGYFTEG